MRPRKIVGSYLAKIYQGRTINVGSNHSLLYFTYWLPNTSLKARVTGLQPFIQNLHMAQAYPLISHILWVLNSAKVLRHLFFRVTNRTIFVPSPNTIRGHRDLTKRNWGEGLSLGVCEGATRPTMGGFSKRVSLS